MARIDPQVNFRMPAELLEKLREASELNNRTLTAELVSRIEASFPDEPPENEILRQLFDEHRRNVRQEIIRKVHATSPGMQSDRSFELPETPEELAALVEARVEAERVYRSQYARIAKLFQETDELLRAKRPADPVKIAKRPTPIKDTGPRLAKRPVPKK